MREEKNTGQELVEQQQGVERKFYSQRNYGKDKNYRGDGVSVITFVIQVLAPSTTGRCLGTTAGVTCFMFLKSFSSEVIKLCA